MLRLRAIHRLAWFYFSCNDSPSLPRKLVMEAHTEHIHGEAIVDIVQRKIGILGCKSAAHTLR